MSGTDFFISVLILAAAISISQCARDYNAGRTQVEMLRIEKECK
jgi:hypothetical protein